MTLFEFKKLATSGLLKIIPGMGYLAFILLLKRLISVEELSNLIVVFSLSIYCAYVLVCGLDSRLLYGSGNGLDRRSRLFKKNLAVRLIVVFMVAALLFVLYNGYESPNHHFLVFSLLFISVSSWNQIEGAKQRKKLNVVRAFFFDQGTVFFLSAITFFVGSTVAPAKVSPVLAVLLILNPYLIYHLLGIFGTKKIKASKVIPTRKCMSYMVQNITPIITNHVFILILAKKHQPEQLANYRII